MSVRIPGVYIEIKGDFTELQTDMKRARQMVAEQATGMSNALNNALSPGQIKSSINSLVRDLGQIDRASKLTGNEFDKLGVDLGELRRHTGLTEREFQKLQSRMLQKKATDTTERALKNIERQAGLTRWEMARLQLKMGDVNGAARTLFRGVTFRGIVSTVAGLTAALAAAAGSMVYLGNRAIEANDKIAKTADKVGLSTDALQELRYAADLAGVGQETLDMAMQRFSRRVGEAAQGQGELLGILKEYNIQIKDSQGKTRPLEDIFLDVADAIKNAGSEQEKLRIAFKSFDSEGAALVNVMRQGSAAINDIRQDARNLGLVIEEDLVRNSEKANDELTKLKRIVGAELQSAVGELTPEITRLTQKLIDNRDTITDIIEKLVSLGDKFLWVAERADTFYSLLSKQYPFAAQSWIMDALFPGEKSSNRTTGKITQDELAASREAQALYDANREMSQSGGIALREQIRNMRDQLVGVNSLLVEVVAEAKRRDPTLQITSGLRSREKQADLYQRYLAGEPGLYNVAKPGTSPHEYGLAVDMVSKQGAEALNKMIQDIAKEMGASVKWGGKGDPVHFGLTGGLEESMQQRIKAAEEAAREAEALQKKALADAKRTAEEKARFESDLTDQVAALTMDRYDYERYALDKQVEEWRAKYGEMTEIAQYEAARIKQINESAFQDFVDNSDTALAGAHRAFESYADRYNDTANNVADAISGTFTSLENALVDFVTGAEVSFQDLFNSLLAEITKFSMHQFIFGPLSGYLSGLTGNSLLDLFSGSSGGSYMPAWGVSKFAEGGHVSKPTLAIVGEKEPETIIPDSKLGKMGGVTVNMNVSVADVRGFQASRSQIMSGIHAGMRQAARNM
jgi:uncharacterized protein YcbK (DUF882 family)